MDRLYNRLDGFYPNVWRAAFKSPDAIANWREAWAEAFEAEHITPQMVRDGVAAVRRTHDMPPSLPQFLKACSPPIEPEEAWREAVAQMALRTSGQDQWSSPAIFWAAQKFGAFDLANTPWVQAKPRWLAIIKQTSATHSHQPVPPYVPEERQLPSPSGLQPVDPATARKDAAKLCQNIGSGRVDPAEARQRWRDILDGKFLKPSVAIHRMALTALRNMGENTDKWETAR